MKNFKYLFLISLLALCGLIPTASSAGDLTNIALEWKANNKPKDMDPVDITAFQNVKLTIAPFTDLRKNQPEIGKNIEKGEDKARLVTTKNNVANWLTERVAETLGQFGVGVVKSGGNATLEADIMNFYVVETGTYAATVALKWRLKSAKGDLVWEGMTSDEAHAFGRSYKADNYFEALGNGTMGAVHALLRTDSFLQALRKVK